MEFTNETYAKVLSARKELRALEDQFLQETVNFAESMKAQGWVEVRKEYEDLGYGDLLSEQWLLFSPSVSSEVLLEANSYRSFEPEDEGVAEEDYYNLT